MLEEIIILLEVDEGINTFDDNVAWEEVIDELTLVELEIGISVMVLLIMEVLVEELVLLLPLSRTTSTQLQNMSDLISIDH